LSLADRILRSLFVSLAVGLGWGIRGDFGHLVGAMFPGAALGMGFAFVSGQKAALKWMPLVGAIGGLGIGLGGTMSYGILHGYAQSDTLINYSYGFFTLVLQGGAWGCFGCALIGLALESKSLRATELVAATAVTLSSGALVYFAVVNLLGFHINPPRSDLSIGYTGGVIGLFAWLVLNRKRMGFKGALFGYLGFGLGMALGRLFANAARLQPYPVNHWNIMEVSCGLIGGFIFTFGMLGRKFPDPPEREGHPELAVLGSIYILGMIPTLHRVLRIKPEEKLEQWANALKGYGYQDPYGLSELILTALNTVCILGFVGAGIWIYLHFKKEAGYGAFPILFFSLLMLLFQNLNALYFFYPRQAGTINMHFVFWVLYGSMVLIALLWRFRDLTEPEEASEKVRWGRWALGGICVYLLIIVLAGFINGEETMKSANTRFPLWSWRDGPIPGNPSP